MAKTEIDIMGKDFFCPSFLTISQEIVKKNYFTSMHELVHFSEVLTCYATTKLKL